MIEVTLSWMVTRPQKAGGAECLTSVTDFTLDDSAAALGPSALRDSLLRQLSVHLAETVFFDVVRITESRAGSRAQR
jgi:hypothetical protein